MGSNPWRDYLKDPREFDGWLQAIIRFNYGSRHPVDGVGRSLF